MLMKKLLFTISLLLCAVVGNATDIFSGQGNGTSSSPYQIKNYFHLFEVRNFVNKEGVYFRLDNDIHMEEYLDGLSWEAIGSSSEPFKGVFLGNNHTITGMVINLTTDYQGLFGCISGATIQNLIIEGTVSGGANVGGIVGKASGTNTIKNCTFNGNVTGSGSYVGGIVGYFTGTLNSVTHTGTTKGAGYVGGIVGHHASGSMTTATNTGNVTATTSNYVGGIAGSSQVSISSANSKGTVTGKQYTGGLAGSASGSTISSCSAEGNVTGTGNTGGLIGDKSGGTVSGCSAKGVVSGSSYTGGLIGQCSGTVSNGHHSGGSVSGSTYVGGLIGCSSGSVSTGSHSGGYVSGSGDYVGGLIGKSTASVSSGRHSGGNVSGANYVGGLIGYLSSGSVISSYTYANVTGTNNVGGIVGYYELSDGISAQIASSGYFGNISAKQYVGGILGKINYNGTFATSEVTLPTTLHTYKTYGSSSDYDNTYQETLTEVKNVVSITNCAAIGDVIGSDTYVGGILGMGIGGEYLIKEEKKFSATRYTDHHSHSNDYYYWYVDGTEYKSKSYSSSANAVLYYLYTLYQTSTSLTDNYFSGKLKGDDYVGGVAGYMHGGTVSRNYSYAAITGSNKVGGIIGYMQANLNNITTTLSSNVTLNSTVTATADAGKIYGYTTGGYLTIATTGTSLNRTLASTSLIVNGITQDTSQSGSTQHGQLTSQSLLLRSYTYSGTSSSGLGWNYDIGKEWKQEDTKSYPYHQWQTAPPSIETGAVKGSTTLTGKCTDDGTVYVTISGSSTVHQATCSGGNWSLTIPTLKSGDLIRAWSKNANKEQSYQTAIIADSPGSGTEADPWLIYDAYDLKGVAKAGYYKMMNDVNLTSWISANSSSTGWPGVGSNGTGSIIFDGNNKKVTGLWCNTTTSQNGLFSYLENATIKDLTVEVASSKQMKGGDYTAILAGQLTNGSVTNVNVKGTVNGTDYTAILVGKLTNSTVTNVTVSGTVTGTGNTAALIANSEGNTISECTVNSSTVNSSTSSSQVGGMLAVSKSDNISNCTVNATVKTTGTTYSGSSAPYRGGVVAHMQSGTMTDCAFKGTVTTSENTARVGALAGYAYSCPLTKCQANATITATGADNYAGGIVGYTNSTVTLCFTEGTVNASGTNTHAGGLVGFTTSSVENCMSTANVTGIGYVGGIVGYTKGSVKKCVATGSLLVNSNQGRVGGIVGFIEGSSAIIKGCGGLNKRIESGSNQWAYRIIGGIGNNIPTHKTTDNIGWDEMPILTNNTIKSVIDDEYEGTAKTTAQLQQQSTYTAMGWDFTDIWTMSSVTQQPVMKWLVASSEPEVPTGDVDYDGSGTEEDPWLIYTAYDLQGVYEEGYYKQMNDIDLTSWISENSSTAGWVPIGYNGTGSVVYDGNNHKVTGLWVNKTEDYAGLFSSFTKGTIRNLTVEATSKQVKGGNYVGIVIGKIGQGTIENVTAKGNVSASGYVGGIAGYTYGTTLNQLSYTGTLTSKGNVGGITSYTYGVNVTNCVAKDIIIYGKINSANVGGLIAGAFNTTINNCSTSGTISYSGDEEEIGVGGLVSNPWGCSIIECYANVNITNNSPDGDVGGLVAYNSSTNIRRCSAAGTVTLTGANGWAGGLVGENVGNSIIEDCYSTANVTGTRWTAGLVATNEKTINRCYASGNVSSVYYGAGIVCQNSGASATTTKCVALNTKIMVSDQTGWSVRVVGNYANNAPEPNKDNLLAWKDMQLSVNGVPKTVYDDNLEGTSITTAQTKSRNTYETLYWNFGEVWTMPTNDYPLLKWQTTTSEPEVTKGDLNGDGSVSITDVVLIIDVIAGEITDANKVAAADVNGDGDVTITDCVAAIDLIAAQQTSGARRDTNNGQRSMVNGQWSTTDFISASMQDNMLNVALNNERSYTAFQIVVSVSEGMTIGKATMDKMRGEEHQALVRDLGNGQYLVAGFSANNDMLTGNNGRLLSIATNGKASGDIVISKVEFATTEAEAYRLADAVVSGTPTSVQYVTTESQQKSQTYDLQGRRVENPSKGLYIRNGKKVNVK